MAQMTGAISPKALKVEYAYSATATTGGWMDFSGYAANVEPDGANRKIGEAYTYDGDTPILTTGKLEKAQVKISAVYANGSTAPAPFYYFRTALANDSDVHVRWSPEGGTTGHKRFQIAGRVISCPPVSGPAESPDPILFSAEVHAAAYSETTI